MAKDKDSGFRLMGFGHRVYKNFDPRAQDPQADGRRGAGASSASTTRCSTSPRSSRRSRSHDEFFIERKLYPNVDFYSGIIYRAMGIPTNMFTVMFALGRLPGWIAHWKEMRDDPKTRINRPRQIYTGATERPYVPLDRAVEARHVGRGSACRKPVAGASWARVAEALDPLPERAASARERGAARGRRARCRARGGRRRGGW